MFGAVSGPSRVSIRTAKDSWVQIRDGNQVTGERVLHPGDTLKVADKSSLILATGNASVLDITVDGRKAPTIGGTIRHTIMLDPDRLLAGTALVLPPDPAPPPAPAPRPPAPAAAPPAPVASPTGEPGVMQPVGN